ncbi:MAG: hypothetical protein WKF63_01295 [Thermomicrobiales bacterium]
MPDQIPASPSKTVPNERDPDYSALVPGSDDSGDPRAPVDATGDAGSGGPELSLADTSGTGTIVAIGCIGATLFLIVIGLVYLGATQLFG